MHDTLFSKRMRSELRDLFKFEEISDNILEMMQDREKVAMED